MAKSQKQKAEEFAALHREGIFVLANAWDIPSAAIAVEEGFKAIATTSAGMAFTLGLPDHEYTGRDRMMAIVREMAPRFDVPLSADLEAGYGLKPEDVALTVKQAIEAGAVGCNIEDADPSTGKLIDFDLSVKRIKAGADAAKAAGLPNFILNARTDPFLAKFGTPEQNIEESIRRGNAYAAAGAGSVFVPLPPEAGLIGKLAAGIKAPLNILGGFGGKAAPNLAELKKLGVRRVSIGGSLMIAAYAHARDSLRAIRDEGSFAYAEPKTKNPDFNALMKKYVKA
jgi:2-methylisocitrate lyase-like PEP mutase family enzyme